MRDNWMDCPDRERSQWWFDAAMDVHQSFYALGVESHHLTRKGLRELASWQKSAADAEPYAPLSLYSPVPGAWGIELPDQSLQAIAYGAATYYDYTGKGVHLGRISSGRSHPRELLMKPLILAQDSGNPT